MKDFITARKANKAIDRIDELCDLLCDWIDATNASMTKDVSDKLLARIKKIKEDRVHLPFPL